MNAPTLTSVLAAGQTSRAVRLLAETTFAMRADAGFIERDDDMAAAVFLAEEPPAALNADALNQVLGRIDEAEALDRQAADPARSNDSFAAEIAALPSPTREAALQAMADHHRWRIAGPGIRQLPLFSDQGEEAILMRIEPGRGVAAHDHEDDELTLVLTGAYDDGHLSYRPGDVSRVGPGFVHRPKADPGDVCYVLVAARGAPKFTGALGLAQRAFGFPLPLKGRRRGA